MQRYLIFDITNKKKNNFFTKKCCAFKKNMYLCTRKTTEHGEVGEWLKPTVC